MLPVFGEAFDISSRFQLPVTISADRPPKVRVQVVGHWMIEFETENVCFPAIEAASRVPHLLTAHLDAPSTLDGVRIRHTLVSGLT